MGLRREYDEEQNYNDFSQESEDDPEELSHKRRVRKMIEERLERKRLKEEFDEFDGDFDWDELDR